jgi:hypothetical protein
MKLSSLPSYLLTLMLQQLLLASTPKRKFACDRCVQVSQCDRSGRYLLLIRTVSEFRGHRTGLSVLHSPRAAETADSFHCGEVQYMLRIVKSNSHMPCRAHVVPLPYYAVPLPTMPSPCHSHTVLQPCHTALIHTCHAGPMPLPCRSPAKSCSVNSHAMPRPCHSTTVLCPS